MPTPAKWLWMVTIANALAGVLLLLVLWELMLAFAVLAPEIPIWPLLVVLAVGLALSLVGLLLANRTPSRTSRRIGYVVNGCGLGFDAILVVYLVWLFMSAVDERFIVPEGYKGDVFVLYDRPDGEIVPKTRSGFTLRIPSDGILRVRGPIFRGMTRPKYFYQLKNGSLNPIPNLWSTTIHATPENLANDRDLGVYFPRTGRYDLDLGCSVEYEQFYVGTKAHLLTAYEEKNLFLYLGEHPGACTSGTTNIH